MTPKGSDIAGRYVEELNSAMLENMNEEQLQALMKQTHERVDSIFNQKYNVIESEVQIPETKVDEIIKLLDEKDALLKRKAEIDSQIKILSKDLLEEAKKRLS